MALTSGTKFGPYEIVAPLGAGGMGEVYRARDTKLGRDVALKLLPPLFTADAHRVARFEREARVLASLNHPHIGAIYGFEDAGNAPARIECPSDDQDTRRAMNVARSPKTVILRHSPVVVESAQMLVVNPSVSACASHFPLAAVAEGDSDIVLLEGLTNVGRK